MAGRKPCGIFTARVPRHFLLWKKLVFYRDGRPFVIGISSKAVIRLKWFVKANK